MHVEVRKDDSKMGHSKLRWKKRTQVISLSSDSDEFQEVCANVISRAA
jgi:hypothetical protein